jgi:hypothetical protein
MQMVHGCCGAIFASCNAKGLSEIISKTALPWKPFVAVQTLPCLQLRTTGAAMLHRTHNSLDLNPGRGTAHCQRIALLANTAFKTLIQAPMAFTFLYVHTVSDHTSPWISKQVNTLLLSEPHMAQQPAEWPQSHCCLVLDAVPLLNTMARHPRLLHAHARHHSQHHCTQGATYKTCPPVLNC